MQPSKESTGQELVEQMKPDAQAEAQAELSQIESGPSEPLQMGDEEARTELTEDPISEGGASRQGRP